LTNADRRRVLGPAGQLGLDDEHPGRIAELQRGDAEAAFSAYMVSTRSWYSARRAGSELGDGLRRLGADEDRAR
jgi:hypothetical protein